MNMKTLGIIIVLSLISYQVFIPYINDRLGLNFPTILDMAGIQSNPDIEIKNMRIDSYNPITNASTTITNALPPIWEENYERKELTMYYQNNLIGDDQIFAQYITVVLDATRSLTKVYYIVGGLFEIDDPYIYNPDSCFYIDYPDLRDEMSVKQLNSGVGTYPQTFTYVISAEYYTDLPTDATTSRWYYDNIFIFQIVDEAWNVYETTAIMFAYTTWTAVS